MRTRMRNKPRSIAFQLILLFTLAAALLLAFGLGIFYSIVVRHASAEDNAVLADKLSAISTDLRENGPEMFAWPHCCGNPGNGSIDSGADFSHRTRTE